MAQEHVKHSESMLRACGVMHMLLLGRIGSSFVQLERGGKCAVDNFEAVEDGI